MSAMTANLHVHASDTEPWVRALDGHVVSVMFGDFGRSTVTLLGPADVLLTQLRAAVAAVERLGEAAGEQLDISAVMGD